MEALQDGTKQGYGTVQLANGETHYGRVDAGTGWLTVTDGAGDVQTFPSAAVIRVQWGGEADRPTDDPVLGGPDPEAGAMQPDAVAAVLLLAVLAAIVAVIFGAGPAIAALVLAAAAVVIFTGRDRPRH